MPRPAEDDLNQPLRITKYEYGFRECVVMVDLGPPAGDLGRGKDHAQFELCMSQIHVRKYARDIWP